MANPNRPQRPRASGGRTLMLLGVLLALAAGAIVIYIVSTATNTSQQTMQVVVATKDLPGGTVLTIDPSQTGPNYMQIGQAFVVKTVNSDFAPQNAYVFSSQNQLNIDLNDKIVVGTFYGGEMLRTTDSRLVKLGTGSTGSLTNLNPAQLQNGQVLMALQLSSNGGNGSGTPIATTGDTIDILVSLCFVDPGSPNSPQVCETQTTLKNVYVYAVQGSSIIVAVSHQDALVLKYLKENGKGDIVVRKPGDTSPDNTVKVDSAYVVKEFGY